jgi:hypothetical protein
MKRENCSFKISFFGVCPIVDLVHTPLSSVVKGDFLNEDYNTIVNIGGPKSCQ